jgi:site-specific DNA-methyltransferase (adenine-specific)
MSAPTTSDCIQDAARAHGSSIQRLVRAPFYSDELVTIYHGDALEVMAELSGIDMVFTSPPYNLNMHPSGKGSGMHAGSGYTANGKTWHGVADLAGGYETFNDAMPQDEYDQWQTRCVSAMWNTLSECGAVFYNHKPRPFNRAVKLPLDYGKAYPLRQIITWSRGVGMNFAETHYLPKSEWIMVWAKEAWRLKDRQSSAIGDVWNVTPEATRDHPAPFPIELPMMAIGSTAAQTILDPFMGSGTTLRAAKDLNRRAIGIEINERYCEIAARRMAQGVLAL